MPHREGEVEGVHFRSDRIFTVNGGWYLQVREVSEPIGPFGSRQDAETVLARFLEELKANVSATEALVHLRLNQDHYREDDF